MFHIMSQHKFKDAYKKTQQGFAIAVVLMALLLAGATGVITVKFLLNTMQSSKDLSSTEQSKIIMTAVLERAKGLASDRDADGIFEVDPANNFSNEAVASLLSGGEVPAAVSDVNFDGWKTKIKYCSQDAGTAVASANHYRGTPNNGVSQSEVILALVSAGRDLTFQTSCQDMFTTRRAQGDDIGLYASLAEIQESRGQIPNSCAVNEILHWDGSQWTCQSLAVNDTRVSDMLGCMENGQLYDGTQCIDGGNAAEPSWERVNRSALYKRDTTGNHLSTSIGIAGHYAAQVINDKIYTATRKFGTTTWVSGPSFEIDTGDYQFYYGHGDFRLISSSVSSTPQIALGVRDSGGNYRVMIFDWNGPYKSSQLAAANIISAGGTNNYFGQSIAVSNDGNRLIIGSQTLNAVYIYERASFNDTFSFVTTITPLAGYSYFGFHVAADGDWIVVDQVSNGDGSGSIVFFEKQGASWVRQQTINPSNSASHYVTSRFYQNLAMDNGWVAYGHPTYEETPGVRADGAVFVYAQDGDGVWQQEQKILNPYMDLTASFGGLPTSYIQNFGRSVEIDEDWLAISFLHSSQSRAQVNGATYSWANDAMVLYELNGSEWQPKNTFARHFEELKWVQAGVARQSGLSMSGFANPRPFALDFSVGQAAVNLLSSRAGGFTKDIYGELYGPKPDDSNILFSVTSFGSTFEVCHDYDGIYLSNVAMPADSANPGQTIRATDGLCFSDYDLDTNTWN